MKNGNLKDNIKKELIKDLELWIKTDMPVLEEDIKKKDLIYKNDPYEVIDISLQGLWDFYRQLSFFRFFLQEELEKVLEEQEYVFDKLKSYLIKEEDNSDIFIFLSEPAYNKLSKDEILERKKEKIKEFVKKILRTENDQEMKNYFKNSKNELYLTEFDFDLIFFKKTTEKEKLNSFLNLIENSNDIEKLRNYIDRFGIPEQYIESYLLKLFFKDEIDKISPVSNINIF